MGRKLLEHTGCETDMPRDLLLETIQNYYDQNYGVHRLLLFSSDSGKKYEFRGELQRDVHKNSLAVYYDKRRYYGVKNVEFLFGNPNYPYRAKYCPDNAAITQNAFNHAKKCPLLCTGCFRHGYDYPCKGEENIRCANCNRNFSSQNCYDAHLNPDQRKIICEWAKCCPKCGLIITKPKKNFLHVCGERLCQACRNFHREDERCPF